MSFSCPSSSLGNSKGFTSSMLCTFFYSPTSLHHKHLPSPNSRHVCIAGAGRQGQMPSAHPHFTPMLPFTRSLHNQGPLLAVSWASEQVIPDFEAKKHRGHSERCCLLFYFSCTNKQEALQHSAAAHIICKLLPHVCTYHQEVQPIVTNKPKSMWTLQNIFACRVKILEL